MSDKSETIDPKTFRKGDRVWVEGVLRFSTPREDGLWNVGLKGVDSSDWIALDPISFIRHIPSPRPIEVGDRVSWRTGTDGKVLAVDGERAWIETPAGTHWTANLCDLKRVYP